MAILNPTQATNPRVGSLVTLKIIFYQRKTAKDPDGVTFSFRYASSPLPTTYTFPVDLQIYRGAIGDPITPSGPGVYYVDITTTNADRLYWGWYATGKGQTVIEGYFDVDPSIVFATPT